MTIMNVWTKDLKHCIILTLKILSHRYVRMTIINFLKYAVHLFERDSWLGKNIKVLSK